MEKVLVLGSTGMAGHVVTAYLRDDLKLDVVDVGPRRKFRNESLICDIFDRKAVIGLIEGVRPSVVVNCLGVLVGESEQMKTSAIWINSYLPHFLLESCRKIDARLVHLSTDCVFSGKDGPYSENAHRDGEAFYDRSKALGELDEKEALTVRCSIIGPELDPKGTGLFNWFMLQNGSVRGFTRALWSGVTTLELAHFIGRTIVESPSLSGLIHYSVPDGISKFELLVAIDKIFRRGTTVEPIADPVIDKRLRNTRNDLGPAPQSYELQLLELKAWVDDHAELYQHYGRSR